MKQILPKFSQILIFLFLLTISLANSVNAQLVSSVNGGSSDVKVCSGNFSVNIHFTGLVDNGLYQLYWNNVPYGTFDESLSMTNLEANVVRDQSNITTAGIGQFGAKLLEIGGVPQVGQPIIASGPTFAFGDGNLPTANSISGSSSLCLGKQTTLTSNPSGGSNSYDSYTWSSNNGNVSVSGNISTTDALGAFLGSSDITYMVTDNYGCTSNPSSAFTLTVNSLPTAPLAGNVSVVYDGNIKTGSATPGVNETIDWYTAASGGTATTAPSRTSVGTSTAYAEARNITTNCVSTSRTQVNVTITTRELTVDVTADDKVYDGNANAVLNSTLNNKVGLDDVTLVSTGVAGEFSSENVANGITVNLTGNYSISGADVGNYSLTQPSAPVTADITPKELTVTVTANNKEYDGNTTASLNASFNGIISGDVVTIDPSGVTATFSNKMVGVGKTVTRVGSYAKSGADEANYYITQPVAAITANITPKALTLTANDQEKCFNSPFSFVGTEFTLNGLVSGDDVSGANFTSAASLIGATASLTPYSIVPSVATGADVNNYQITYTNGNFLVHGLPTPSFTINDASQCLASNSFELTNTSNPGLGASSATYFWSAPSSLGLDVTATNQTLSYTSIGNYSVNVQVTSNKGCVSTSNFSNNLTVVEHPTAFFTTTENSGNTANDYNICTGATVNFNAAGSTMGFGATSIATYQWRRDGSAIGGSPNSATYAPVVNGITNPDLFDYTLRLMNNQGCWSNESPAWVADPNQEIYVYPFPVPSFTTPVVGTQGQYGVPANNGNGGQLLCHGKVVFANTSTIPSGSIVRYVWMYGDGSTNDTVFTADNVKHEFPVNYTMNWFDPGFPNTRRNITLIAKSDEGCVTSVTNTRDIKNGPDAIIGLSNPTTQALIGNSFLFHNASMNRHPSFIDSSLWNWGDGSSTTNTTFIPKVYTASGNYRVHLINYTGTGCTDTAHIDLTVGNPVTASFTNTNNTCGSTEVSFTSTSTAATIYSWDFGDGNTSTLANPTHTYAAPGSYNVILTVNGSVVSAPKTVHVVAAPVVGPIVNNGPSTCGNVYSFSNVSTGINLGYTWTFSGGTGVASNGATASRSYAASNVETVDLVVTADGRCPASAIQISFTSVAATLSPVAGVTVDAASVPTSTSKAINNTSTNGTLYFVSLDGAAFTLQTTFPYDITGLSNGSHTIRLVASDLTGTCKDTASATFTITNTPCAATANFDIQPTSTQLLSGNNYTFFNTTQVNGFGWIAVNNWNFGDGTTASTAHVYGKTFAAPGTYVVTYTATLSPANCTSTITKSVTVTTPTSSTFTHVPNNCSNLDVAFTSTSTGANTYLWNFGDGNTSTLQNPTHSYSSTGSYSVVLTINGSVASAPQTIHVVANPVVGPIVNNGPSTCGNVYTFSNLSSGVNLTYDWAFSGGTGSVSTSSTARRMYAGVGSETVALRVSSDGRCSVDASDLTFTSVASTTTPLAAVSVGAASLPSSTSVSVNNASTNASLYYVSLDGAAFTAEFSFPYDITGLANGAHSIRLVASDLTGTCKDTATANFNITSTPCVAVAGFNITPAASQPLSTNRFDFFNTTQHNGFGWVVSNAWNFGDGTTNIVNTHVYGKTYAAPGTYTVTLMATSSTGCYSTYSTTVTVTPSAVSSFTYVPNVCGSKLVSFTNTAVSASSYLWNFGDGNTSTAANPTHTYAADGNYTVTLRINGNVISAGQVVSVVSNPVAGTISSALNTCGNIYTYSVAGASGVNLSYAWSFSNVAGAGSTSGNSVTRTYSSGGAEIVSLSVIADGRCSTNTANLSLTTLTEGTPVSADLQVSASNACNGTRTINNVGSSGATSFEVSVDGGGYVVKSTFPYDITGLTAGTHTVRLKAINGACSDIATETFVVGSLTAGFTVNSSACGPTVNFTNTTTSTFGTPTYAWDFNNAESTSSLVSPSYTFGSAGTKTVSLVATLPNGCVSTLTNANVVANVGTGAPVASFTSEMIVNGSCNTGIKLTSTSTGASSYVWNYGDGTVSIPSTTNTIFHAYASTGTFTVTLTASGACGTSNTATANVVVSATGYPTPEVSFSTDIATQCVSGNRFDFFNRTQLNGWGWVPTYRWYFGDGTTDFVNTFAYGKTYAAPGTYTVKLVGISNRGCADSSTMQVVVLAPGACTPGKIRGAENGVEKGDIGLIARSDNQSSTTGISNNSNDISNDLVLYPNPNNGSFKLTFKELKSNEYLISIVDMLGREVYSNNHNLKGSKEVDLLDLNLAPGSYNIVLNGNNDVFARKSFVVIK